MKIKLSTPSSECIESSRSSLKNQLSTTDFSVENNSEIPDILTNAHNLLSYSSDDSDINMALSAICRTAENLPNDKISRQLLLDCILECRNFLYSEMIEKRYGKAWNNGIGGMFDDAAKYIYTTESGTILTKQQKKIMDDFNVNRRLIISAPTSFGKTRLLMEIIHRHKYQNVGIIMPTISLTSETMSRIRSDNRFSECEIINSVTPPNTDKRFIYVLTPEKMDLLLDENSSLKFDFFAMDEIYKVNADDERRSVFASVLYRLSKTNSDFYLIGPYFDGFSERFNKKSGAHFRKFNLEIVQKDEVKLYNFEAGKELYIDGKCVTIAKDKKITLSRICTALNQQKLIYCAKKREAESVAKLLSTTKKEKIQHPLIEYIKQNISDEWSLIKYMESGIAFHHSAMPRYVQVEIVEAFNKEILNTLACTTTLTEGVNTTAKNVVIYSDKKGSSDLSGFDYKNVKGRAGRFMSHFVGRIFSFHKITEEEKGIIDFHFYDNEDLESDEVLYIDASDLRPKAQEKRLRVEKELHSMMIPIEIVKKNKYIETEKQISLVKYLRGNPQIRRHFQSHVGHMDSELLGAIIDLSHQFLFNKHDAEDKNFGLSDLKRQTRYYAFYQPSHYQLIKNQNGKSVDTNVRKAFYLISHYFEFALPKYLTCFMNLYEFVAKENGEDYELGLKHIITKIQYGFSGQHEIILKEAGVPDGIIRKMSNSVKTCRTADEMRSYMRINPEKINTLTEYEKEMLFRLM